MKVRAPRRRRPGFTLLEMAVVIVALGIILSMTVGILWGLIRIERSDAALFTRLVVQSAAADQFRGDVARSVEMPAKWEGFEANSDCLILRQKAGRSVVYHWDKKQLRRWVFTEGTKAEQVVALGTETGDTHLEFVRSDGRLCVLKLVGEAGPGSERPRFKIDVAAALGGEVR